MNRKVRIALDAMGGDYAPATTVNGAIEAVAEWSDIEVVLVGDEAALTRELQEKEYPESNITIKHASEFIVMDDPFSALRRKKDSSIKRAMELHRDGGADAVVSAGHSGITMATALLILGKSPGVERPAIAAIMPTYKKQFVLIDAGANVDCAPENLLQFALMADAYCRLILERPRPKIGLLSIGEEASKGNELTKEAFKLLSSAKINFAGNVEGRDIFLGNVDAVVCDGFIGNVMLKTAEGLAEVTIKMLKREITGTPIRKLGYLLMKPVFRSFKRQTDYAEAGGAPLLGINGACIICHGRSSEKAIKNALKVAAEFARKKVNESISEEIKSIHPAESTIASG